MRRWLSEIIVVHRDVAAESLARRACVGQKWAEHLVCKTIQRNPGSKLTFLSKIFIAVASMLAAFNIEKAVGEDGKPIPPNDRYRPGLSR